MTSLPLCLSFILLFVMQRFLTSSQEMWGCVPGACSIRCGRFPGQSVCHQCLGTCAFAWTPAHGLPGVTR